MLLPQVIVDFDLAGSVKIPHRREYRVSSVGRSVREVGRPLGRGGKGPELSLRVIFLFVISLWIPFLVGII